MFQNIARTYDELKPQCDWPLSRLFHEESKLSDFRSPAFREQISNFNQDHEAVRQSSGACRSYPGRDTISLPRASSFARGRRLRHVLRSRRTRRDQFADQPVRLRELATLLEMACGVTGEVRHPEWSDVAVQLRAWPSGGALYPIETYVVPLENTELNQAVYHYQPQQHVLTHVAPSPKERELNRLVYAEGLWDNAGALLVLTAEFTRTQIKYGERGYRFVLLDAGHLAQNILLMCEDLRLAAIPLGGFDDDGLAAAMHLTEEESPLYAILIGKRRR